MITSYGLLLHSVGLSIPEAARLHKTAEDTIVGWRDGELSPPDEAANLLYALIELQTHAANWVLRNIRKHPQESPIRICVSDDERESGTLGWPTASVMNGATRRLLEMADNEIRRRTRVVFNPQTTEDRCSTFFISIRLRADGSFADPDDPDEE
jgi:hypothetical protein